MATYVIGDYIREIRLRKGYTQEDVSLEFVHLQHCRALKMERRHLADIYWIS